MKHAITLALAFAAMGCTAKDSNEEAKSEEVKEFVCYDDDKLSERHVGVSSARLRHRSNVWFIVYTNDVWANYTPRPGEACTVEEYTRHE